MKRKKERPIYRWGAYSVCGVLMRRFQHHERALEWARYNHCSVHRLTSEATNGK